MPGKRRVLRHLVRILTVRNFTRYTPRYRISEVHGIEWPVELIIVAQTTSLRGPIRKHEDLLKLIDMSIV